MFGSHLIVAAAGYTTLVYATSGGAFPPWHMFALNGLLVLIGCILPDIDTPKSRVGRALPFIAYPASFILGHRGVTHSLLMVTAIAFAAYHYSLNWLLWLALGYFMHLVGDYLTDSGIPALWPSKKRFRFVLYGSTNSISEPIIVMLFLGACAGVWSYI